MCDLPLCLCGHLVGQHNGMGWCFHCGCQYLRQATGEPIPGIRQRDGRTA